MVDLKPANKRWGNVAEGPCQLDKPTERMAHQEQKKMLDSHVAAWVLKMREDKLIGEDVRQFADDIIEGTESSDFKYAGMLRNLMRLFSAPGLNLPVGPQEGAELVKAFHDLKNLLAKKDAADTDWSVLKTNAASADQGDGTPLSPHDKRLLADVERRLRDVDCDEMDLSDIGRMKQSEAVAALDAIARKRMRQLCRRGRYDQLFSNNEQASWSVNARKGFASAFETAVYELVRDDAALSQRRK